MTRLARVARHPLFWPLVAFLVMVVADTVATNGTFLSIRLQDGHLFGPLIDIVRNGSPLLLVALGMTLVIATRGIDLSVGAVVAISGALALSFIASSPDPNNLGTVLIAIGIAVGLCLVLGAWNGFLVSVVGIQPIIATLILMTAGRGIAMLITGGFITTVNSHVFKVLGSGFLVGIPVAVIIAGTLFALTALVTRRSALGVLIEAVGINPAASRMAGVRSRDLIWIAYAASGLFSGVAGLLIAANTMAADANHAGLFIELQAILAVVLGGTQLTGGKFSLSGTLVGVLVIQTLGSSVTFLGIPPTVTPLFEAVVVIAVSVLQSPAFQGRVASRRRPARVEVAA
jgi:simple sugar transport system permease protein